MKRLLLDAGPLIALVSVQDDYYQGCKAGFSKLPALFGEVLTPLPVLFEVYKFVLREQSSRAAMTALGVISENTVTVPMSMEMFQEIYSMVRHIPDWQGSLEDASVVAVAQLYNASVWTLDYRDLSWFKTLKLWSP
ncbi:MAG: type II toxin-antitoxin system VapC family toxin [Komarekiella atlantica HA4396-MV6]|jgi:predicted nucleic acid-binding protein|nr:type II toxin-antitoxin system VapC family toxin [Komarekiella atlantica HA4396-MV6]